MTLRAAIQMKRTNQPLSSQNISCQEPPTLLHNIQQAARVSDFTLFLYLGQLIEYGITRSVFNSPSSTLTKEYITGEFG